MTAASREVCICDDDGDAAFARAAPLLERVLQLVAHAHAVASATRVAYQQYEQDRLDARCGARHDKCHMDRNNTARRADNDEDEDSDNGGDDDDNEMAVQQRLAAPYLADATASFASLWRCCHDEGNDKNNKGVEHDADSAATRNVAPTCECVNGLILPVGVRLRGEALSRHAMAHTTVFAAQLHELLTLSSSGVLFTACQARLRVLQSRYALYRAYNSFIEDAVLSTPPPAASSSSSTSTRLGGGSGGHASAAPLHYMTDCGGGEVAQAAHVDVRRVETCVCANTLVRVVNALRRDAARRDGSGDVGRADKNSSNSSSERAGSETAAAARVASAMRRYFGSDVPASAQVLTVEQLHVQPNYAAEASQLAELDCSIESCAATATTWRHAQTQPHEQLSLSSSSSPSRARELLCRLLHLHPHSGGGGGGARGHCSEHDKHTDDNDDDENGEDKDGLILGRVLVPTLRRLLHSSASSQHAHVSSSNDKAPEAYRNDVDDDAAATTTTDTDVGRRIDLELTVTGSSDDEVAMWARWCVRSGLLDACPSVQLTIRVAQGGRDAVAKRHRATVRTAATTRATTAPRDAYTPPWQTQGDTADATGAPLSSSSSPPPPPPLTLSLLLRRVFAAVWAALCAPQAHAEVARMLRHVSGFAVYCSGAAEVQDMPAANKRDDGHTTTPDDDDASGEAALLLPVADVYFAYHVWRNVQAVNAALAACARRSCACVARLPCRGPLRFRVHGGERSRGRYMQSVLGLLLADEVVNPASVFEWGPLCYAYYLVQRSIALTPSRNRVCAPSTRALLDGAVTTAVQTGLHAALASVDPLLYSTTDDAAGEEMHEVARTHRLCGAEVCELCLHAVEARAQLPLRVRTRLYGGAWWRARARYNIAARTHVHTLRLQHREAALVHELQLLRRTLVKAQHAAPRRRPSSSSHGARVDGHRGDGGNCGALSFARLCVALHGGDVASAVRAAMATTAVGVAVAPATTPSSCSSLLLLSSSTYVHTREGALRFPRIVITGPRATRPAATAKALVRVLRRRRYYAGFAGGVAATTASSPSSPLTSCARDDSDAVARRGEVVRVPDTFAFVNGVFDVQLPPACAATNTTQRATSKGGDDATARYFAPLPSWRTYQADVRWLRDLAHDAALQQLCAKRLHMLECKYQLHTALTNDDEGAFAFVHPVAADDDNGGGAVARTGNASTVTTIPPRHVKGDLHNIVKVDVHCHMAGGMTARALLSFMKHKLQHHPDDVVAHDAATAQPITLAALFDQLLTSQQQQHDCAPRLLHDTPAPRPESQQQQQQQQQQQRPSVQRALDAMTVGLLDVQAGTRTFNRFDEFNSRYSPMRASALRSLFLKTDNSLGGHYFAELARATFASQAAEGNTYSEYRLSIYGRHAGEWQALARWFVQYALAHPTNRWLVQVPRLYALHRRTGAVRSFADMLHNLFAPLWAASRAPSRHADLHAFLSHVSGFDSVDDESDREAEHVDVAVPPQSWVHADNPPYAYYMYHMWANIATLNRYRAARGLSTFAFRPHGGESGDADHMADVLLLADGVGHGIQLRQRPVLQYLYYLAQVPLAVVPLSNNALFCRYADNPLPLFLRRGLLVALGTDGALMFHHTEQPLMEEYGVAQHYYALSGADMCELAHNSVRMSGFTAARKRAWLDELHELRSVAGNAVDKTHVPVTRCAFRYEVYMEEVAYLAARAATSVDDVRAMRSPLEEDIYTLDTVGLARDEVVRRRIGKLPLHDKTHDTMTPVATQQQQQQQTTGNVVTAYATSHL